MEQFVYQYAAQFGGVPAQFLIEDHLPMADAAGRVDSLARRPHAARRAGKQPAAPGAQPEPPFHLQPPATERRQSRQPPRYFFSGKPK